MAKDALETQQLVKNNCEEVTQQLKKLREWQKEIKEKEKIVKMNMDVSFFLGVKHFFFVSHWIGWVIVCLYLFLLILFPWCFPCFFYLILISNENETKKRIFFVCRYVFFFVPELSIIENQFFMFFCVVGGDPIHIQSSHERRSELQRDRTTLGLR